ncbi:MAG TPA: COG1615 family transporter, partial [Tissierellia bacterium]|nr:COG1615 family transporter [Tissierellia bacterium]
VIGLPVFIILTIFLYVFVKKLKKKYDEESQVISVNKKVNLAIKLISAGAGLLITLNITSTMWFQILQYINSEDFGTLDPIFNNDVSFYVFKLPLINTAIGSLISILFLMTLAIVLFNAYLAVREGIKNVSEQFEDIRQFPRQNLDLNKILNKKFAERIINQISIIGFLLFLLLGARYALRCYDLLYSRLGRVFGAGYTDINITLNLYRVLAFGCALAAFTFFVGARKRKLKIALALPVALILVSILGTGLAWGVEKFIVEPDQLSKETLYMQYSIKSTQKAYGLDDVKTIQFPARDNLTIEDIENNPEVIENIRINDQEPLIQVYNQLQGIRPYYVFYDVDVDRYVIDGEYRQVFLSARELDQDRLNEQARTWVNLYLKYTHGYGITVSTVNNVTPQGQPEMLVKNIPPTTETDFKIVRPEIYFGEKTNNYIIVNTDEMEFDYPSGADNVETLYEGKAGINLSFFKRLLFSIREGSYRMLISKNIDKDSRIIINRNIIQRVS